MSGTPGPPTGAPAIPEALLSRFGVSGPRYTSYPTADRFVESFGADDYRRALARRVADARSGRRVPLSLYVHIPFCESICYYCACNKVVTRHHERAAEYLDALEREMELHTEVLGTREPVSQVHFGGGTPTFLSDAEIERLMASIRRSFAVAAGAEISIEVDPRTVDAGRLAALARLGFNRLSFGVQDFDPDVQKAVNRIQSYESVRELVGNARDLGFESVNIDLIYGLPKQTRESFRRTLAQAESLRPDRIALYAYAHLPQRFKPQRHIDGEQLPAPSVRIEMLGDATSAFLEAGYDYIGMDHFALPGDSLAVAWREGLLHRNFQGYSTQPDCDLIGLGVSAIGRMGETYSQNAKSLPEYYAAVERGALPIVRGLMLDRDDLVRRAVIMAVMCQGRVEFASIGRAYGVDMHEYFAAELRQLRALEEQGLVELRPGEVRLTPVGRYLVRAVAMVFDRHLQADQPRERFSAIV